MCLYWFVELKIGVRLLGVMIMNCVFLLLKVVVVGGSW